MQHHEYEHEENMYKDMKMYYNMTSVPVKLEKKEEVLLPTLFLVLLKACSAICRLFTSVEQTTNCFHFSTGVTEETKKAPKCIQIFFVFEY